MRNTVDVCAEGRLVRLLKQTAGELARIVGLLGVGLAWALPFLLAAFVNSNSSVAAHPRLASALGLIQFPLVLGSPVIAALGIGVVAWLLPRPAAGSAAPVVALLAYGCVVLAAVLTAPSVSIDDSLTVVLIVGLAAGVAGAVLTTWSLWRSAGIYALVWPVGWAALGTIAWVASARTVSGGGNDLGSGLLFVLAGSVLGVTLLVAAAFAEVASALAANTAASAKRPGGG